MSLRNARCGYLVRAGLVLLVGGFLAGCGTAASAPDPLEVTIFDNGNILAVFNNPTAPTVFTTTKTHKLTFVSNYHWNDAHGQPAGTIWLTNGTGQTLGPWTVTTRPGQGGVPNAYWDAVPNLVIPPGTYTVGDSSPATWSQNPTSGGRGFTSVKGVVQ